MRVYVVLALFLLVAGCGAAQPDKGNGQGPPWMDQSNDESADTGLDWTTAAASVVVSLIILGGAAILYRRFLQDGPVTVQTDADAVLAVLDAHGGQVKQPVVQEELDWSAAKVSRVTSTLEEDEELEKLRLGRENILRRR